MAIRIEDEYTNATAADADYPEGSFKNISAPGLLDGTPLEKAWPNDIYGFLQKLLDVAGITPSGVPDTVLASDYYDALIDVIEANSGDFASGTVLLFGQASAPTGWTKLTTWQDNAMLTINTQADGTALGSGGSVDPQLSHSHGVGTLKFETGTQTVDSLYHLNLFNTGGSAVEVATSINNKDGGGGGTRYIYYFTQSTAATFYTANGSGSTADNTQPHYQEIIAATKD